MALFEGTGTDILLSVWVAGSPGSYKKLVCLREQSVSRSTESIDTSSKCSGAYTTSLAGRKNIEISFSGISKFTAGTGELGYDDLKALWASGAATDFKIFDNSGSTDFDAQYFNGRITSLNDTYSDQEVVTFEATISVNGAETSVDPHA